MTISLLKTKLHIPPTRSELVSRPCLIERLDAGLDRKLTLLSAPAGFGKTTLLSEWVTQLQDPAAWLSLDEADNDGTRFWMYLIAALQTVQASLGQDALTLLQAPQQPATQTILTTLLNEIAALPRSTILVLDDYHLISARAIHEGIAFLLEHLPPQMHVAISTRADPPLPIHRLRARGQLTELRSDDLRFSVDEATAFLNAAMGLDLVREDVEVLEARTEGWIVGLQLAALSLQGRADAREFITAFSGGHHYVLEYLTEEVVRRQPEPVQRFLMQTSILGHLCGPLCDAVRFGEAKLPTGESDGEAMLAHLRQRNLFILPLDDEYRWHRYHHLFADLLGNLLRKEWSPEYIRKLHTRACEWYDGNGWTADAVNHALAAKDFERTAQLIEHNSLAMVTRGELTTLLRWIEALPEDVAHSRPWLCVHQAWPLTLAGKADAAEPLLRQIEQQVPPEDLSPEYEEIFGHVAAMRAMLAVMHGDMPRAVELAHRADELLPPDNLIPRNTIPFILASAYSAEGNLAKAGQALNEELRIGRAADNLWTIVRSMCDLADLQIIQGKLRRATDLVCEALQQAEERGGRRFGTVGYALVKLGEIFYARNELIAARDHIVDGVNLMQGWQQPYEMVSGYTALATVLQAQNDAKGALEALQNAEAIQSQYPHYRKLNSMVHGCRVRLCLAQDGPDDAARLATEFRLGENGVLIFREQEQMILVRVLIAQRREGEALLLLAQLEEDTEAGGRYGRLIEILTLQAVLWQMQGDTACALSLLERALVIGELEGYERVFVAQGAPMATLLQQAAARGIAPQYVSRLLTAAEGADIAAPALQPTTPSLVEPLTGRELEVLQLLGQGCSNQEIAEALVIT
ncbi:MAG TPA: LuxR C-terminal-related transcriptional regulator, partial [Anaerolineae bacterium]|nr:LuxR C-terminal-related transcriptional regulator [Anaerolineae bacterium]